MLLVAPGGLLTSRQSVVQQAHPYGNDNLPAFYYGGRGEIVDAFKKILEDVDSGALNKDDIDEDTIKKYTYLDKSSYPEIVLRTGHVSRLSNFLLWHSAYSELYFIDKLWPEIKKQDLLDIIEKYKTTKKNFGE